MEIYSGFSPGGGVWADRDPSTYETILSGDLNGDDSGFTNNDENSYHVVTGSGTDEAAVLDGFTITAGNANGDFPWFDARFCGGGMYSEYGSPTVANCTFTGNAASLGGGMCNYTGGHPTLIDCTFADNQATSSGGGIYNYTGASPTLTGCTFTNNQSGGNGGGGMYNSSNNSPTLTRCTFSGNGATTGSANGGGIYTFTGSPTLIDCAFMGNSATIKGGGMYNHSTTTPVLINCIFSGNTAGTGAGMHNHLADSKPTLTNCTFSGNVASIAGGGVGNGQSGTAPVLTNCILWGNSDAGGTDESAQIDGGTPFVFYSCLQGWTVGGIGNIGSDPSLVDADGADNNVGTDDDNLRLSAGSPCIDAGNKAADTDINAGGIQPLPATDLDGNARVVDDPDTDDSGLGAEPMVDMGAYEFQP